MRIYLAPKFNGREQEMNFMEQRILWCELDKFTVHREFLTFACSFYFYFIIPVHLFVLVSIPIFYSQIFFLSLRSFFSFFLFFLRSFHRHMKTKCDLIYSSSISSLSWRCNQSRKRKEKEKEKLVNLQSLISFYSVPAVKPGKNHVVRSSKESSITNLEELTFKDLENSGPGNSSRF